MHERQFLIGPGPREGWPHSLLAPGAILSRHPALPFDGETLGIRLGDVGRYLTIADGRLEPDACGTLGVLYRRIGSDLWISSSPELLRELAPELPLPGTRLAWGSDFETFPPPLTGLPGCRRLLPTQMINVTTGEIVRRRILVGNPPASYAAALEEMEQLLRETVRAAAALGPIWIPLTGGSDSRVVLAACRAEGLDVITYTFDYPQHTAVRDFDHGGLPDWDRTLPPLLAAAAGYEHRLVPFGEFDAARLAAFDRHTCWHSADADRMNFVHGQWDAVPTNAIILGGNVFELGRGYYYDHQPQCSDEWRVWDDREIDWRDRLYLEQRLGGWLAAIEQGFDLNGHTRIHVANGRRFVTLLLSQPLPEELRRDGIHQSDLISRMAPELAHFSMNRPASLSGRVRKRLERERSLVAYHGGFATYMRARGRRARLRLRGENGHGQREPGDDGA